MPKIVATIAHSIPNRIRKNICRENASGKFINTNARIIDGIIGRIVCFRTLTLDIPGFGSSFRSLGASCVTAEGIIFLLRCSVSACKYISMFNGRSINMLLDIGMAITKTSTHISQWLKLIEFKRDDIMVIR